MTLQNGARIYIAGADTLIGSAIFRAVETLERYDLYQGQEPDFSQEAAVADFLASWRPDYLFIAAGDSGGIGYNQRHPVDLMMSNLQVVASLIPTAHQVGVKKLLYLASSCIYPKLAPQPLQIGSLFTGPLEPTNQAYAMAKLSGLTLCQAYQQQYQTNFIVGIPANAFGVGDDFSPENAHVVGALIAKMHHAKLQGLPSVEIWGTGQARREFIFADDLAQAALFVMQHYNGTDPINLGTGADFSIAELAQIIKTVVGYEGALHYDTSKPDGMPLKSLDSTPLHALGWQAVTPFMEAIQATYAWFLEHQSLHEY